MLKLYQTYKKAKDLFIKPTIHFSFGRWINNQCLPVWRRGPKIRLGKSPHALNTNCYAVKNRVQIFTGYSTWKDSTGNEHQSKCYDWAASHKLPEGLKPGDIVWKRDTRKKLRKFRLSWIKPCYKLPIWLSFYIFNHDIGWKTKWGDTRYEYPPQFTIVFFGLAFSIWLSAPKCEKDHFYQDGYWEGIIDYGFYKNKEDFDPVRFIKEQGFMHWTEYTSEEKEERNKIYDKYRDAKGSFPSYDTDEYKKMKEELTSYPGVNEAALCIRECHIKKNNLEIYHKAFSEMKEKHPEYIWLT